MLFNFCGYSLFGKTVVFQTTLASSNLAIRFHEPLVEWLRHCPFKAVARVRIPYGLLTIWDDGYFTSVTQLVEYSTDNGEVFGSSPNRSIGNEQLQDVRVSLMIAKIVLAKQSEQL